MNRRRLAHHPTDEQIMAERIRLGIIKAQPERLRVMQLIEEEIRLAKQEEDDISFLLMMLPEM